jgi:hypothetical protein
MDQWPHRPFCSDRHAPQTSTSVLQDGSLSPRQQQSHTLNASSPFSTLSVSHSSASTSASLASSSSSSNNSNSSSSLDELVRFIELHDDAAVRRHLKKHPAHVNDPLDAAGRTPLMLAAGAALHTDTAVLRTLLRCDRVVVNARDAAGNTALHHLVRHGARGALFADALEAFAQHRADFSARNAYHETLLHAAVSNAVAPVAVRCVLEREAVDLAVRTMPDSLTALHYALQQQNLYAVELLLEWGAAVERAPRDMTLLAAAFPPPATARVVALLRMHEGWQERMSVAQHQFVAFYHTQRLPDPWTAVPEAWSTLPERDALIIKIVNSEIAHAHDIALFGRRYAPVLQRLLSAVEARDILSSLPLVHVVTRRLASLLASTKYEIGEVFNGLFSDISVSYENICAAQDRIKAKLRHMCQSNKELADALEKKAVDSHGAADTSHSLFSMLNVPLLRLFEHKKLLTQLLEWTPTLMADHAHLTLAVQSYEELFKRINEKNRRFGRVALARNLTMSFDVPLSPESEMTCAGPVRLLVGRHWRAANAYLCSDRLFLCDSSSKKAKLVAAPDVHGLRVHEHAPDAPLPEKESPRRAFVVESALGATFVLAALADDDKPQEKTDVRTRKQWLSALRRCIEAMRQQLSRAPATRRPSIGAGIGGGTTVAAGTVANADAGAATMYVRAPPPGPPKPQRTVAGQASSVSSSTNKSISNSSNSSSSNPTPATDDDELPELETKGSGATTEEMQMLSASVVRNEHAIVLPEASRAPPAVRPPAVLPQNAARLQLASNSVASPVSSPRGNLSVRRDSVLPPVAAAKAAEPMANLSVDVRSGMRELALAVQREEAAYTPPYMPIAAQFDTYASNVSDESDMFLPPAEPESESSSSSSSSDDGDDDDDSDDAVVVHDQDAVEMVVGGTLYSTVVHGADAAQIVDYPVDIPEPPPLSPPSTPPTPRDDPPPPPPPSSMFKEPSDAPLRRR